MRILFRSTHVPDKGNQTIQSLPVANYSPAIATAVEWLGDRYLLAKPINAAPSRERKS
jgi:hypothetical protein